MVIDKLGLRDRYYRSFVSYEVPFQPEGEIPFAETEGLRSFYVAHHNSRGFRLQFMKILLVREGERIISLPEPEEPGSRIYFRVVRQNDDSDEVGSRVEYSDTEGMTDIFEGRVGPSGRDCEAILFRREQVFKEIDSYWPNGALKSRSLRRSDGRESFWHFDESDQPQRGADGNGRNPRQAEIDELAKEPRGANSEV